MRSATHFAHAGMAPVRYQQPTLGSLARDVLRVIWREPAITTGALWRRLGFNSCDSVLLACLANLRANGMLHGEVIAFTHGRTTEWAIADSAAVGRALSQPARAESARNIPYIERFANPDFGAPPPVAAPLGEPAGRSEPSPRWVGPIAAPRLIEHRFTGPADHRPVVRAGSLDALRLRSLRWETHHRSDPAERLAVVEAVPKGQA